MKTLDWYLDTAKARHAIPSENQLAGKIGVSAQSLFGWRQKRGWPTDGHMIEIATLAGVKPEDALMDLRQWSAKEPEVKELWQKIAKKLKSVAAILAVWCVAQHMCNATTYSKNEGIRQACARLYCILWRLVHRALRELAPKRLQPLVEGI